MNDVLVVVVAQTTTQLLVVHFRLVLANAPSTGHLKTAMRLWSEMRRKLNACMFLRTYLIRVGQLELPAVPRPRDERLARLVHEQL